MLRALRALRLCRLQTAGVSSTLPTLSTSDAPAAIASVQPGECPVHKPESVLSKDKERSSLQLVLILGKHRLTSLVVSTTALGYLMSGGVMVGTVFPALIAGTFLQSMAANTLNQVMERNMDVKMKRTTGRPLVTGEVAVPQALTLLAAELALGTWLLSTCINPLTANVGLVTFLCYVGLYTPAKRLHWTNTWIGAVVGALPPVMGCTAVSGCWNIACIYLFGVLFLWQIPHFLSLSYMCRKDYAKAGFQMLSSRNSKLAAWHSVTHAAVLATWCLGGYFLGAPLHFLWQSSLLNGVFMWRSYQFWGQPNMDTAIKLFRASLWYLPILSVLMLVHWTFPRTPDQQKIWKQRQDLLKTYWCT